METVEQNLERRRGAERVGEELIHGGTESSSIFIEDRKGDEVKANSGILPKKKGLKSLEILNNHSGALGLTSRARKGIAVVKEENDDKKGKVSGGLTPEQRAIRAGMSKKEIEKLRRLAGRDVKGAFGVVVEDEGPKNRGVETMIGTSTYDVWSPTESSSSKGKGRKDDVEDEKEGWAEVNKSKRIRVSSKLGSVELLTVTNSRLACLAPSSATCFLC